VSLIRFVAACMIVAAAAFGASPHRSRPLPTAASSSNKSKVYGNATLFDGSLIETAAVSSDLVLQNGTRLRLVRESQAASIPTVCLDEGARARIGAKPAYSSKRWVSGPRWLAAVAILVVT